MPNYFSVIEELSKKLDKPWTSWSSTTFSFSKNGCSISVRFEDDSIYVEGFVGGGKLCLDSDALSKFIGRLTEVPSLVNLEIHLSFPEIYEGLYPVFPRIRLTTRHDYIARDVETTYQDLTRIKEVIDELRVNDKSFESLKEHWKKMLSSRDKNEKGRLLEEILSRLIAKDENFTVIDRNLRTESEELDIIAENTGITPFYSQLKCPIILFECKNWSSKIGSKEIRDFAQKIQNRPRVFCSIGVLVTTSELTSEASTELVGYRGKDFLIGILERKDIETILDKRLPFGEFLRGAIRKAGLR